MKKLYVCALVVSGMLGVSQANAQILLYRSPSTQPGRSPLFPYSQLYGMGQYLYGQASITPPGSPSPTAPGYGGIMPGVTGRTTMPQQQVDQGTAGMTGHPTRFLSYSHYFFNQGGGGNAPLAGTRQTPGAGSLPFGMEYAAAPAGASPQRPAKSGSRR